MNEKKNLLEAEVFQAVFNYIESNPAENINVTNKVMVDVEETEDVYLAIEKGLKLISILQVSYSTIRYYLTKLEDSFSYPNDPRRLNKFQ